MQLHWSQERSPCLHPLQVVQEVLQVQGDPQVPEYHLFQRVPEVLSLPVVVIDRKRPLDLCPPIKRSMCTGILLPVRPSLLLGLVVLVVLYVRGDLWVRLGLQDRALQGNPTWATAREASLS